LKWLEGVEKDPRAMKLKDGDRRQSIGKNRCPKLRKPRLLEDRRDKE
jgi:hypothetical protein